MRLRLAGTEKGQQTWDTWIGWVTGDETPTARATPGTPPPARRHSAREEAAAAAAFMEADRRAVSARE